MTQKSLHIEELPDEILSPEEDAAIRAKIAQAEQDLAERFGDETRVNVRWGKEQVALVKRAAAVIGMPYQVYIKDVVWHAAVRDLERARQLSLSESDTTSARA